MVTRRSKVRVLDIIYLNLVGSFCVMFVFGYIFFARQLLDPYAPFT